MLPEATMTFEKQVAIGSEPFLRSIMSGTLFDSLPYYDNDTERYPELQDKVVRELAKEGKPPTTIHPKVPPPFELFSVRLHHLCVCSLASLSHATNTEESPSEGGTITRRITPALS